jgi:SAM-dependent MidA family methyltransferase
VTPLGRIVIDRIAAEGPMRLDVWMALCLGHPEHGYYATRDPFGAAGDFTTAPEISQMFGEMIGAWLAQVWLTQGAPDRFILAEFGPGRGTLMADALRAASRLPGFRDAAEIWLVETSPALRHTQAATLAHHHPRWADDVASLPDLPLFAVANEFFDALPIRQFQRAETAWRERRVDFDGDRPRLVWGPPRPDGDLTTRFADVRDGAIVEICAAGEAVAAEVGDRIAARGGALVIIDYGEWDGTGDTFQSVSRHAPTDPLAAPGEADLTAHVRFRALAEASGLDHHGPVGQGEFLERLGITERARALASGREGAALDAIVAQHRRLTHPEEMGRLFRALALVPPGAPSPPGFGP